jgi:aspartate kinase
MSLIVSKFGGTSMGDASCMLRSAEVSFKQKSYLVVVSATSGTTNLLIELGHKAQGLDWSEAEGLLENIKDRHLKIAKDLQALPNPELNLLFEEMTSISKGIHLLRDCSPRAMDTLVSFGERMSSVLFVQAMNMTFKKHGDLRKVQWLDVREILLTDDRFGKARPQLAQIEQKAKEYLKQWDPQHNMVVTQGFIGRTQEGQTTTLGRGGSDYSAAILAEAIDADTLEIWTDVAGIATTDPRLVPEAKSIEEISFQEASELATFGAKILHPATLIPAMRKNIPVYIGSSFDDAQGGTWIRRDVKSGPVFRALALRKKQVLVTLTTPTMLHTHGFLFNVFKVFNDNQISIDAITTSEISVSLTLDDGNLLSKKVIQELSVFAEVQIEENLSLISIIGNNINHTSGLAKKIFETIADVNVRMICLGASKHNFCFLVSDAQGPEAIQKLHRGLSLVQ